MSSIELYDKIYKTNLDQLIKGNIITDDFLLNRNNDKRIGISLIVPVEKINNTYNRLINNFVTIEPNQYYYPSPDLHFTVFDFIQCRDNYQRNETLEKIFLDIARKSVTTSEKFNIKLKGIVFTREAGIMKGYDNNKLITIRNKIRELLVSSKIKNDERYISESAHITFARFKDKLKNPAAFCEFVERNKEYEFGEEEVTILKLVEHDWYNSENSRRLIGVIKLKNKSS